MLHQPDPPPAPMLSARCHFPQESRMSLIAEILPARSRDLGGFTVQRLLPAATRQMVGPFIFLDHIGPAAFAPGEGVDIPPHPHIGLATVTYLFEGALLHRDSLGTVQEIHPGDVNWMSAGRGIAHSERTPVALRLDGARLHGLQFWVALPLENEEDAPDFQHHPRTALPRVQGKNYTLTLIAGRGWGLASPVRTPCPLVYADVEFTGSGCFPLPAEHEERALYVVSGSISLEGDVLAPGQVYVLEKQLPAVLETQGPARLVVFGGTALAEPRRIWWNFVASSPALIAEARRRWADEEFAPVPGETERLPLPVR
jgi:redox-sensitive bicupin YhaK (pirin superfamily)